MNKLILQMSKKVLMIMAIFVISFALLMSIVRLLTPLLDNYHQQFETWASELLHLPIRIKTIAVDWYQYQPAITFNETTILDKDNQQPLLQIKKVRLFFSLPASLWHWRPIASAIQISGTSLVIHQDASGEYSVQGFPALTEQAQEQEPYPQETKFGAFLNWLAMPGHFILHDTDIHLQSADKKNNRWLTLYDVNLKNNGENHFIYGKAVLHQTLPTDVTIAIDWQGNILDLASIRAKGYAYFSALSLGQWLAGRQWQGWEILSGLTSAKIWATWQANQLQKIQAQVRAYDIDFYHHPTNTHQKVNRLSGHIGMKHDNDQYLLAGNEILIDFPDHLWPYNDFSLRLKSDATNRLIAEQMSLAFVDLRDAQRLVPYIKSYLPEKILSMLPQLNLRGFVQGLEISFPDNWQHWPETKIKMGLRHIAFNEWENLPSVEHFSALLNWNGTNGQLKIDAPRFIISKKDALLKPISLDNMKGNIDIAYHYEKNTSPTWHFSTTDFNLANADFNLIAQGSLKLQANKPQANINAKFSFNNIKDIIYYLPLYYFPRDLQQWFLQAFVGGSINDGHMQIHGNLKELPFTKNGLFEVTANIQDGILRYAPTWPLIKDIKGKIRFYNQEMQVQAQSATTLGIALANVQANIPYLGSKQAAILNIKSDPIAFQFAQGINFIHHSPLNEKIGKIFKHLNLAGAGNLQLHLNIPLKEAKKTHVLGEISFPKVQLKVLHYDLPVNNLNGQVQFTEKSITAHRIQGELFDQPITLNLATTKNGLIHTNFTTTLQVSTLEKWLHGPINKIVNGQSQVLGQINIADNQPLSINLRSDLLGIGVHLPEPFAKTKIQSRMFTSSLWIQPDEPLRLKLNYANVAQAALIISKNKKQLVLNSAVLRLGPGEVDWAKTEGWYVQGNFKKLDWQQINHYLQAKPQAHNLNWLANLKNINVDVKRLILGPQTFSDINVILTPSTLGWQISLRSNDVTGDIQLPTSFTAQQPLQIRLQHLNLRTNKNSASPTLTMDIKDLPAIDFNSKNVVYNNMPLGTLAFTTQPNSKGININTFSMQSPLLQLTAQGQWLQNKNNQQTELQGVLRSQRLTDLVRSLHLDTHNFIADKGEIQFDLTWPNAPYAIDAATIDGDLSIDIGKGQLVDIGKESSAKMDMGRMLSLFSLQTLPRRLSLDFSDLFQKGYSFDSIKGDFHFSDGSATTDNMRFAGPVAKVQIKGRIGFSKKDFDLILKVTPYVTSSIPVAATLITGQPLVGIAAWAVNKVIGAQVSKATTYTYTVTGPWMAPVWNKKA